MIVCGGRTHPLWKVENFEVLSTSLLLPDGFSISEPNWRPTRMRGILVVCCVLHETAGIDGCTLVLVGVEALAVTLRILWRYRSRVLLVFGEDVLPSLAASVLQLATDSLMTRFVHRLLYSQKPINSCQPCLLDSILSKVFTVPQNRSQL
jgi:hypothetical protein